MTKLKVAAIQAVSLARNFEEKWAGRDVPHALELLDRAAAAGADLACLPELYPLVGREELSAKARETGLHIVAGLAEGTPEQWYNTSVVIDPSGALVGSQTKNYPTAGEVESGVVAGTDFQVFETALGRLGIVICADFAFFHDGVEKLQAGGVDILVNPAVWFALAEAYPHSVVGRHLEYSMPVIGVNVARPQEGRNDRRFPPAGGYTTVCVPPPVTDMDELWDWFCTKPGGIDSASDFVHTLGPEEGMLLVDIDVEAVRRFPGYFSTRKPVSGQAAA